MTWLHILDLIFECIGIVTFSVLFLALCDHYGLSPLQLAIRRSVALVRHLRDEGLPVNWWGVIRDCWDNY